VNVLALNGLRRFTTVDLPTLNRRPASKLEERFSSRRVAAMLPDLAEFRSVVDRLRDELK